MIIKFKDGDDLNKMVADVVISKIIQIYGDNIDALPELIVRIVDMKDKKPLNWVVNVYEDGDGEVKMTCGWYEEDLTEWYGTEGELDVCGFARIDTVEMPFKF